MLAQEGSGFIQEMVLGLRLELLFKLVVAVLLGGAIGLERQVAGKAAGLRTNILICLGATLLMDLSIHITGADGRVGDPARLAAQVVVGIGFLGAGTIMQSKGTISGLTTAATIWVVAALGLTIGAGYYIEGLGAGVLVLLVLSALGSWEHKLVRAKRTVPMTIRAAPMTDFAPLDQLLRESGLRVVER
ncbi:MAG: MgtC/SapB family protein, partial [Gemmatimonadaceae bacterium]|nr:MgtC/SapB family protein [Gemmatimonadaceae bacterium]